MAKSNYLPNYDLNKFSTIIVLRSVKFLIILKTMQHDSSIIDFILCSLRQSRRMDIPG